MSKATSTAITQRNPLESAVLRAGKILSETVVAEPGVIPTVLDPNPTARFAVLIRRGPEEDSAWMSFERVRSA
ncbi:MAG: hypothetical protein VXZ05_01550 [Pseudomonadota bacterium]|nr:hypothetical protein [Pseudomonadota bacterium]